MQKQQEQTENLPTSFGDAAFLSLIEKYKQYPGSAAVVRAVDEAFNFRPNDFKRKMLHVIFTNNEIKSCNVETFRRLAAHWNNIAFGKLNTGDYSSYVRSLATVGQFRVIAHYLEYQKAKLDD